MDAKTVANYMLYLMGDAFDDLTNMKINKLLYFAQGYFLAKHGKPLFTDTIEAWAHGPVVPAVYASYKEYGDQPIRKYDPESIPDMPNEVDEILYGVARTYGKYTTSALRNITHAIGSPWDQVYQENRAHIEIPTTVIQDYFAGQNGLAAVEKQFKESDFIGYRDEDGVLVLPKEWDDEEV